MKPKKRRRTFLIVLLLLVISAAILVFDSNTRIVTTEYELSYPNLPEQYDGFRIVQLSDLHSSEFGKDNTLLIEKVRDAKPDIIAVTGDIIDRYQIKKPVEKQLEVAEALVTALVPIAPVYYVTGNHEWDSGAIWPLLDMLEERGVHVLRNQYHRLETGGGSIIIAGAEDPNGPADGIKPADFVEKIFEDEGAGFIVMLTHRNNTLPLYSSLGVDLVLCGHAHGGIVRLPFTDGLVGPNFDLLPTYTNGVYTMETTNMVVSRGLGNHIGWPRFLNNPHIAAAVLKRA